MIKRLGSLILAMAVSLLLVSLFLWINGYPPARVFAALVTSTWGSTTGLFLLGTKTALLILTGLAVAVPFRAGLFNIGGEGQLYLGALAAAALGAQPWNALGPLHGVLCMTAGCLCGALWGGIAAGLKSRRGIHEVITTIMLNFIAFQVVNEMTLGVLNAGPGSSRTAMVAESARFPLLYARGAAQLTAGIVLSVILAAGLSWMLHRTWFGFHLRAVGGNPTAAAYAGIAVPRIQWQAMLWGGGCAGLAGALQVTSIDYTLYTRFGGGYGFDGIAVAFLGLCEPWATIPAALIIATLRAGDRTLQLDLNVPREMVFILEGLLIIGIALFTRMRSHE